MMIGVKVFNYSNNGIKQWTFDSQSILLGSLSLSSDSDDSDTVDEILICTV